LKWQKPKYEVKEIKDNYELLLEKCQAIYDLLGRRPILFLAHNTLTELKERYIIAAALKTFVDEHENCQFIDPASLVAFYGKEKCILKDDQYHSATHQTEFFNDVMAGKMNSLLTEREITLEELEKELK